MGISEQMTLLITTGLLVQGGRFLIYDHEVIDITNKLTASEKLSFTKEFKIRKKLYFKLRNLGK